MDNKSTKTVAVEAALAIAEGLAELVYPPNIYCMCCGAVLYGEPYGLCAGCKEAIGWVGDHACERCGKPLQDWYTAPLCLDCEQIPHAFSKGFSCVQYDEKSKKIIHGLKYGGKGYLAKNIGCIMADRLGTEKTQYDSIIPVPAHQRKRKTRGYNQAVLIAREFSRLVSIPIDEKTLIRSKKTDVMAKLSAHERRQNLADAFAVTGSLSPEGGRFLLVDDVYTTGSTADGCAAALMAAGAGRVDIITFAAGQNTFKNQSHAKS